MFAAGIDLTRMECKDTHIQITPYLKNCIDLTRMECKDLIRIKLDIEAMCIDLTRMECKGWYHGFP